MGRSQETFNKKEVRSKKEKKRKEKAQKRQAKKDTEKKTSFDDMIAYVDENGRITSSPPDPNKKNDTKLEDIKISVSKSEPAEEIDPIRKGKVNYFNDSKGFGFIKDIETQESIFVHINNIDIEISEGLMVSFEIGKGPKGPIALNVKLIT